MAGELRDSHALVLNSFDHGESDKILTLLTQDFGRISCIAKGAKKSKKRFVNKLEIFSFIQVQFTDYPNRSLSFLNEAELHTPFLEIRSQFKLYAISSIIQEFLLQSIREREQDNDIYTLTLWALHNLCRHKSPHTVLALFLIRFFEILGYRPEMSCCHQCGLSTNEKSAFFFQFLQGGLLCTNCWHGAKQAPLSRGTIKFLNSAQDQSLTRLHRIKVGGQVLRESLNLLHHYGRSLLQRDITSWFMLNV